MKHVVAFFVALLFSIVYVNAHEIATSESTVGDSIVIVKPSPNAYVVVRKRIETSEIPNDYKSEISIDIPDVLEDGQDQSVEIPNPGYEKLEHQENKNKTIFKRRPKFLPDTAK